MAVKISAAKPIVPCPAQVFLAGDNGARVLHAFTVNFKRLKTAARDELNDRYVAGDLTMRALLNEIVMGWGGMLDEAGEPVPYTIEERIATDDEYPGTEQAILLSWFENFFINQREAAIKNSKALSGTTSD